MVIYPIYLIFVCLLFPKSLFNVLINGSWSYKTANCHGIHFDYTNLYKDQEKLIAAKAEQIWKWSVYEDYIVLKSIEIRK